MRINPEKELEIKKSIMHILDNKSKNKLLSDIEMDLDQKTKQLLKKHITNSVNDEYVRLAKFQGEINVVQKHCQTILINDNEFANSSKEIANYLYDAMEDKRISPAYLVVSKVMYDNECYISLLKLDFNENLTSETSYIDGKRRIDIVIQGMGLPNEKQKLHKCVFYKSYKSDNDYDIILLDKQAKGEAEIADFFAYNFLHCALAITDRENTKNFCSYANKFVEENFENNLEKISTLKEKIITTLKSDEKINLVKFAETTFGEQEELIRSFVDYMTEKTIDVDFNIDKPWVDKNVKRKRIITDTGIEIKLDEKIACNGEKFLINYPYPDKKKADIVIKNVTYREEPIK